jgi:cytochrome c2
MRPIVTLAAAALAALAPGCGSTTSPVQGADAEHGRELIRHYGCGSCHTIGGIDTANGTVGPRLTQFRSNRYLAGDLANTPENAASWIQDPKRYEPGTIMPDLGVTAPEARDIVAYLLEQ